MFNAEDETKKIIKFIRNYYEENNLGGVIIGISGGKDSGVVAGLFTEALGKENVIGVTLPCHSNKTDKSDAKIVSDYYGFKLINFDLTKVFDDFKEALNSLGDFSNEETKNSDINLKPRLRMASLYYLAAMYSAVNKKTYLVAGTSNKCELYVGYFTKGGDSVHDISVIADFTVEEVIKIGEYLKVPKEVLYKTPNDGLSNQTDEDKLGVSYKAIANYMENKDDVSDGEVAIIERLHNANKHKFNVPTYRRQIVKVGVFVGSFDPIHIGHIGIIDYLINHKVVDRVIVIATNNYWDKQNITDLKIRLEMLDLIKKDKVIIDKKYNGFEYTYQILDALERDHPGDTFYLVIGADNANNLHKWKNYEGILKRNIIVINRNNVKIDLAGNNIIAINKNFGDVSSTMIRKDVKNSAKYLDSKIYDYIIKNDLYR